MYRPLSPQEKSEMVLRFFLREGGSVNRLNFSRSLKSALGERTAGSVPKKPSSKRAKPFSSLRARFPFERVAILEKSRDSSTRKEARVVVSRVLSLRLPEMENLFAGCLFWISDYAIMINFSLRSLYTNLCKLKFC